MIPQLSNLSQQEEAMRMATFMKKMLAITGNSQTLSEQGIKFRAQARINSSPWSVQDGDIPTPNLETISELTKRRRTKKIKD